jgi:formate-dependent nitrite reductase membrane component NrfD
MIDAPSTWFSAHPQWHWLIVLYFFFGGLAGGLYVLAALIDLMGRSRDRPLARVAYLAVLPCLAVSSLALVFDLSRPDRFWHILVEIHGNRPLFQPWTPLNSGAWVLLGFSFLAVLSALGALAEQGWLRRSGWLALRPPGLPGIVIAVCGILLGLYIAAYEGALLAFTSRPIWSETPLIGAVLALTALSMAAAFLWLFARWRAWDLPGLAALARIDAQALAVALLAFIALLFTVGGSARALASPANLLMVAVLLVAGFAAPLCLRLRGRRLAVAAALTLAGGFLVRTFIVFSPYGASS